MFVYLAVAEHSECVTVRDSFCHLLLTTILGGSKAQCVQLADKVPKLKLQSHATNPRMADSIKSPLLLIHGDADNNPGTHTMQVRTHGRLHQNMNSQIFLASALSGAAPCGVCRVPLRMPHPHCRARSGIIHRPAYHMKRTLQSERFYAALKGHGCPTRLVLLPHESHGYGERAGDCTCTLHLACGFLWR